MTSLNPLRLSAYLRGVLLASHKLCTGRAIDNRGIANSFRDLVVHELIKRVKLLPNKALFLKNGKTAIGNPRTLLQTLKKESIRVHACS